ncbi:hypothetical protein SAY86_004996 [Trapa natans]|uniref:AP2/ERF domain-containing protein n=1 Tax=Trapa natans TaxID=22666 RepID=A0AAN7KTZ3_TRANT|nr:hypothetical protein SAY86_004996 [Trapa natans]
MLDLNVEIISKESSSAGDDKVIVAAEEESGIVVVEEAMSVDKGGGKGEEEEEQHSVETSDSSSVVNDKESLAVGPEDVNSSSAALAAFVFDVLKKDDSDGDGTPATELATRQLFPVPDGNEAAELGLGPMASASTDPRNQWLKLSFTGGGLRDSGGPAMTGELIRLQLQKPQQVRKSRRGPRSRSSQYRGVTFYRRTGRWESHIWDCGKQVYLGGFDTAYAAARAYDRAAIKFRGAEADINFNINDYEEDMKQMGNLTKEEFVHVLRRQGTGFSRSNPKSRAMVMQRSAGPWGARIGQFIGAQEVMVDQFNGQEVMSDLDQQSGHKCLKAAPEANSEGICGQHLDLNLGMAPVSSSSSFKKISAAGNHHASYIDWQGPSRDLPMIGCSGVPASSKPLLHWPGTAVYPFVLPNSEGKVVVEKKRRTEAPSSSNIGWQMGIRGNYGVTPTSPSMPLVFSMNANAAASSGFSFSSSSSSSNSPSTRHLHHFFSAANRSQQFPAKPNSYSIDASNPSSSSPFLKFRN